MSARRISGRSWAAALAILFAAVTAVNLVRARFAGQGAPAAEAPVPVETVRARTQSLEEVGEWTGDVRPGEEVDVYAKVPGKVVRAVYADEGDEVHKGDLLAELETGEIRARLAEAEAGVAAAQAGRELAEKEWARVSRLFEEGAVSRQERDRMEARLRDAAARLQAARAVLRRLRVLRADHRVTATMDGYVSARWIDPGGTAPPGRPLFRISSDRRVKILFHANEEEFPRVREGTAVRIRVDAHPDRVFSGRVAVVHPTLDPATRTAQVEVRLENPDRLLRGGMFARVSLVLGRHTGVVVPRDSLQTDPGTGRYYLYVVRDGRAVLRNVRLGIAREDRVEILDGVAAGEEVVVRGQNRLAHGRRVTVQGAADEEPGA